MVVHAKVHYSTCDTHGHSLTTLMYIEKPFKMYPISEDAKISTAFSHSTSSIIYTDHRGRNGRVEVHKLFRSPAVPARLSATAHSTR